MLNKEMNKTNFNLQNEQIDNVLVFIKVLGEFLMATTQETQLKHENYMSILYSMLTLMIPILERFNNDQFILFINVMQSLIVKIITLDLNFETRSFDLTNYQEETDEHLFDNNKMQTDNDFDNYNDENECLQNEVFAHLDSKKFSNRLECILSDDNGSLCFSVSYLFYFMLKIAKLKVHESNMLRKVAFNKVYLNKLWRIVCSLKTGDPNSRNEIYYLQILASGKYFFLLVILSKNNYYNKKMKKNK
jgi:hypothetical protein